MEKWKPVVGYESLYKVSDLGRVMTLSRLVEVYGGRKFFTRERLLKPGRTPAGYPSATLSKNGVKTRITVHRLVMKAFVGHSDLFINHKNCIRHDNRLDNLEYVTQKQNMQHALLSGSFKNITGQGCHLSRLSNDERRFIISQKGKVNTRDLAKQFSISIDLVRYYWKKPDSYLLTI